jgi:hypothetical protein
MSFLISMTVAAAANNSDVKNKNSHHKGSHVAKKAKTALDPDIANGKTELKTALDPDIANGKTELTPLQANKYNLGDYAGSSTFVDTPDGASNTFNMGVNAGIQFDDGPYPGNKILQGEHAGTTFNFGNSPGIVYNNAPKKGFSGITTNPKIGSMAGATYTAASNAGPKTYAGKYLNTTFTDTKIL